MATREYIETVMDGYLGLPWYHHWYSDIEWAERAKQRGVYVVCLNARFKHYHPALGTGPTDYLYQLGQKKYGADKQTLIRRQAQGWPTSTERKERGWRDG